MRNPRKLEPAEKFFTRPPSRQKNPQAGRRSLFFATSAWRQKFFWSPKVPIFGIKIFFAPSFVALKIPHSPAFVTKNFASEPASLFFATSAWRRGILSRADSFRRGHLLEKFILPSQNTSKIFRRLRSGSALQKNIQKIPQADRQAYFLSIFLTLALRAYMVN